LCLKENILKTMEDNTKKMEEVSIDDTQISALLHKKKKKKKKKKSKKKKIKRTEEEEEQTQKEETSEKDVKTETEVENENDDSNNDCNYDYADMLNHAFETMQKKNPNFGKTRRYVMKPPLVARIGSKKTSWMNFTEICGLLKREPSHVLSFYLAELATEGSSDASGRITFKGLFKSQKIQSLLKKYIGLYVMCAMCRSPETDLNKDQATRLYFVKCNACGASRTVQAVKAGFQAMKRGERRKARMG
jgi:translation initiation factor 2 subunit 2